MIYDIIERRFNVTMLFNINGSSNWMGGAEGGGEGVPINVKSLLLSWENDFMADLHKTRGGGRGSHPIPPHPTAHPSPNPLLFHFQNEPK